MITNLFSIFDPSSLIFSSGWAMLVLVIFTTPLTQWNYVSPLLMINNNIVHTLYNEISFTINNSQNSQTAIILGIFLTIILINFTALYPQIFSLTSHLSITLPLSLVFWLTPMLYGWTNNTNHILVHLVPQGTPEALMIFIVLIELTSNLIRPITLCVRLTANLIAGHLLITLLGNALIAIPAPYTLAASVTPLILTILESAVAGIQAYVFITLVTLYTTEAN